MSEKSYALARNAFAQEKVTLSLAYVDITGDLIAGLMLSQIMYWFSPSKSGNSKIRIKKKDGMWLAKSRQDWYNELRITPKQCSRAIDILCKKKLIEKKLYRFNGSPTLHVRPIWEEFNHAIDIWESEKEAELEASNPCSYTFSTKGKNPICQKVKMEIDKREKTLTDTTSVITTETTSNIVSFDNDHVAPSGNDVSSFSWDSETMYANYLFGTMPDFVVSCLSSHDDYFINTIIEWSQYYFKKYEEKTGTWHPWYKKETLSKCLGNVIDLIGDDETNIIFEYTDMFFKRKGMRGYEMAVFSSKDNCKWLEAEILQDFNRVRCK